MAKINKVGKLLSLVVVVMGLIAQSAWAGPFVDAGGAAATPTKYAVTIKKIEFRRSDSSFYTFYEGAGVMDLGAISAGANAGAVGAGSALPPGTYNGMRMTVARDFTMSGSADAVGPGGDNCRTGNAGDVLSGGYTVQNMATAGAAADRVMSIPTQADAAIDAVSGLDFVGGPGTGGDLQVTVALAAFTVAATDTVPPTLGVQFDVANKLEFIGTGGACLGIVLPPTVTVTTPSGTTTFTSPI